jgi:hypothetical protein
MEPEGSLPLSEKPATCSYPEPDHSSTPPIPLVEDDDMMMMIIIIMCQTVV